jgi:hypoxanthine phosphoribosyltransferase
MSFHPIQIESAIARRGRLNQLVSVDQIKRQVQDVASYLKHPSHYGEKSEQLIIVPILSGAVPFYVDLVRELGDQSLSEVFFVWSSSYSGQRVQKPVEERKLVLAGNTDLLRGKRLLIVDDVIETGATLTKVCRRLKRYKPADIKTAVVCRKKGRVSEMEPDYHLFEIPDVWIAGYGLDGSTGRYRGFRWIGEVSVSN